jgi:hypothetical protein
MFLSSRFTFFYDVRPYIRMIRSMFSLETKKINKKLQIVLDFARSDCGFSACI